MSTTESTRGSVTCAVTRGPFVPIGLLHHLDEQLVALLQLLLDRHALRRLAPGAGFGLLLVVQLQALGIHLKVGDVEEGALLLADVQEKQRLNAGQDGGDLALEDVADDAALPRALDHVL